MHRRCRNRQHLHYCPRHGRFHHHHSRHRHQHQHEAWLPPKQVGQRSVIAPASRMNPAAERTVWEENTPDSLLDICTRYVLQHPQTYCYQPAASEAGHKQAEAAALESSSNSNDSEKETFPRLALLPDLILPTEICEKFFSTLQEEGLDIEDTTASVFSDTDCSRLRSVNVRGTSITDRGLLCLLRHQLRELDVHNCEGITRASLENINSFSNSLVSLNIGNSVHILPDYIYRKCGWRRRRKSHPKSDWSSRRDARQKRLLKVLKEGPAQAEAEAEDAGAVASGFVTFSLNGDEENEDNLFEDDEFTDDDDDEYEDVDDDDEADSLDEEDRARCVYDERGYILRAPKLQKLCIRQLFVQRGSPYYFDLLLKPLPNLTHLDLSGAAHFEGLGDFSFLNHLSNLVSLVLHNVAGLEHAVFAITKIKTLRHLDISQPHDDHRSKFPRPNHMLSSLVENLPELCSLDISGTNLAGSGAFEPGINGAPTIMAGCDIQGLASRTNNPLDFLGMYMTKEDACFRANIPAKKVAGEANEAQILTAGQQYLDRPSTLEHVLNDLFLIFRVETCAHLRAALDITLMAMDRHPGEKSIQISGSAIMYYIVKSEIRASINIKMKKKILSTLLNGMFAHKDDTVMMRNGCLILSQFSIPQDVIFDYKRLVRILLYIVSEHASEEQGFMQRTGMYMLNSLACQLDGQQKLLMGNLGAMEKMLALIRERVSSDNYDDVMETAWSCMWNVTDETPVNCKRFMDGGGMQLFLRCKQQFPDKQDLLRNMMGLLGNVAEVPSLRKTLMTKEFVAEFSQLLDSNSDGIEVSYNAAGVLAHMMSDGATEWTIAEPTREAVLARMVTAIERWNLNTKRNINYRSFEPILRLVRVHHTPQCQHWATWALANLTRVDNKYCALIEQEGGLTLLEELINRNLPSAQSPYTRVVELASAVRENVATWKQHQADSAEDDSLHLDG